MGKKLVFDFMNKDIVCSHVEVGESGNVQCQEFDPRLPYQVFYKMPHTVENLNKFFADRCFPKERVNCQQLLDGLGLKEWNPLDIIKLTHGVMWGDTCWIRFEGETLTYKDIQEL